MTRKYRTTKYYGHYVNYYSCYNIIQCSDFLVVLKKEDTFNISVCNNCIFNKVYFYSVRFVYIQSFTLIPFIFLMFCPGQSSKCKIKQRVITRKTQKIQFFLNVCCVVMLRVFLCRSVSQFLYGPFCHDALNFDISTLFTTFFI